MLEVVRLVRRDDVLVPAQLLGSAYTFILQKQAEN
jgi:hypothetical protein